MRINPELGFGSKEKLTPEEIASLNLQGKSDTDPKLQSLVKEAISMDAYIKDNYSSNPSATGIIQIKQLKEIGNNVRVVHDVSGDGNCFPTAFATSLIYILSKNSKLVPEFLGKLFDEKKDKQVNGLSDDSKKQLEEDVKKIIAPLCALEDTEKSRYNFSIKSH